MRSQEDAPEEGATITRDEAQAWFTRFLLHRVRRDDYTSTTQLDLIEKSIPREILDEYLQVLVDKVARDTFPSVPLLYRIQHLIKRLPHLGYDHRPPRAGRDDTDRARRHRPQPARRPTPRNRPADDDLSR